jgi:hypothetical protein
MGVNAPADSRAAAASRLCMSKWLARFAFSFILLAVVFAWEGRRRQRGDVGAVEPWKVYAFYAAAALCFGLGLRGIRERHRTISDDEAARRSDDDDDDETRE